MLMKIILKTKVFDFSNYSAKWKYGTDKTSSVLINEFVRLKPKVCWKKNSQ